LDVVVKNEDVGTRQLLERAEPREITRLEDGDRPPPLGLGSTHFYSRFRRRRRAE
jgi:hypothetical protein